MWFKKSRTEQQTQPEITEELISTRAYELWQARGCPASDGAEDWQNAKEQLLAEFDRHGSRKPLRGILRRFKNQAA